MVEFLRTSKIASHIEDIIVDAKEHITFVTPYLKFTKTLYERLVEKDEAGVKIIFVYGKKNLQYDQEKLLKNLKNISIYFLENLHAKCYTNEFAGIVTSMNLYDFSEKNNREMGIFFRKTDNESLYTQVNAEVESIIKAATLQHSKPFAGTTYKNDTAFNGNRMMPQTSYNAPTSPTYNQRLIEKLKSEFKDCQFEYILRDDMITSVDFSEDFLLNVEPKGSYYRLDFRVQGIDWKDRKRKFDALYDHRYEIEKHFPRNVVVWGGSMLRIKFDFPQNTFKMNNISEQEYFDWISRAKTTLQGILNIKINTL
jgi:phosphatidylserine/phosphatidylglycerophosphate/cardiolipin synthase-like enzyme